jgi:pectate lyase
VRRTIAASAALALVAAGLALHPPAAAAADSAPIGFAAVNALGRNGTTGGAGGPTVTVTNATDFIAAIAATGPRVVRVQGTITLAMRHRAFTAAIIAAVVSISTLVVVKAAGAAVAAAGAAVKTAGAAIADGFASVDALGQNGTTGGAAGPTVTVTTAAQLADYAGRNTPFTILVQGRITFDDMITVVANKSIIGVGSTATIDGGGLQLGSTTRPGNNVIIRNLTFVNASDDSISVTNAAHHVWIDHNDLSDGYDGLLDIKRKSTTLVGHSDSWTQDVGYLKVTYHPTTSTAPTSGTRACGSVTPCTSATTTTEATRCTGSRRRRTPAFWWRPTTSATSPTPSTSATTRAARAVWSSAATSTRTPAHRRPRARSPTRASGTPTRSTTRPRYRRRFPPVSGWERSSRLWRWAAIRTGAFASPNPS